MRKRRKKEEERRKKKKDEEEERREGGANIGTYRHTWYHFFCTPHDTSTWCCPNLEVR
jgi:hypothetical protein